MGAAIGTGSAGSRVILSRIQFAGFGDGPRARDTASCREDGRVSRPQPAGPAGQAWGTASHTRGSMVTDAAHSRAPTLQACDAATLRPWTWPTCNSARLHPIPWATQAIPRQDWIKRTQPCRWEPPKLSRTITHVLYAVRTHPGTGPTPSSAGSGSGKRCCSRSDEGQATDTGSAARRGFPAPSFA